jgi:hypothetical protein
VALLGFQDRFVPLIESGAKQHTIRGPRADIAPGTRLDLYARPRRADMRLIFRVPCVKVEVIELAYVSTHAWNFPAFRVWIDGEELGRSEREALALRDGFSSLADMCTWWQVNRCLPFRGHAIHWNFARRTAEARRNGRAA